MALRKLPVGIQSFEDLRRNDYVYVDKTAFIRELVETGKVFFLSRPRRFGKSLFISTLEAYFAGKKELFQGLAVEDYENEKGEDGWQRYPVIRFSLSGGNYQEENGLRDRLENIIKRYAAVYELTGSYAITGETPAVHFVNLIEQINRKTGKQVVVLVDEYDKPLLETMEANAAQEERNRQLYKGFFSVLKDEDAYLKFVFFTGVTKFSKVSIFSDLNQLDDISLDVPYSEICGITEEELRRDLAPEIRQLARTAGQTEEMCLAELAGMYDGYHFSKNSRGVYNPFSLLNALRKKDYGSYWFDTGTPTFLIRKLEKSNFTPERLSNGVEAGEDELKNYRPEDENPIPLFFQSGYLTISGYEPRFRIYSLKFPNEEVKDGFMDSLAPGILGVKDAENPLSLYRMTLDLEKGNAESFMTRLTALFAGIPYPESRALDYEQEWRNQIFLIFTLLGQQIKCEVHSAGGRADSIAETERFVYIFEFKVDQTADAALEQIEEKGYALPYGADSRKIFKIGVNFSSEKRNIEDWKMR